MKNISDLVLLMVIAVVFLQKKNRFKGKHAAHLDLGCFQNKGCNAVLWLQQPRDPSPAAGGEAERVGWGQGGVWKVSNVSQHSRARSRSDGLQPGSVGVSVFQT